MSGGWIVRLFFAVFPDSETRRRVAAAAEAFVLDDESRRVPCENYHLTLAFIGEVQRETLVWLKPSARRSARSNSRYASIATSTGLRLRSWWPGPLHVPPRSRICAAGCMPILLDAP